jgi:hypothetical protein
LKAGSEKDRAFTEHPREIAVQSALKRAGSNRKWWLRLTAVAGILGIVLLARALSRGSLGKITIIPGLEFHSNEGPGTSGTYPAHFSFQNRQLKILAFNPVNVVWRFLVLTNNSNGAFLPAFETVPVDLRTPDDGGHYEFWLRDPRLLDCDWKLQVNRTFRYYLPAPLSSLWRSIRTPADIWETDTMHRSVSNWKWGSGVDSLRTFRFPDRVTPTNELPAFLTNGGSLFGGDSEIRYVPEKPVPATVYRYAPNPASK